MSMGSIINHRPQFVSKGPPIPITKRWAYFAVGTFAALIEGTFHVISPHYKEPAMISDQEREL